MTRLSSFAAATAVLSLCGVTAAQADQFIISMAEQMPGASEQLLETLHISIVDEFEHDGVHFVVLDAPNTDYLETLFYTLNTEPKSIGVMPVDWASAPMTAMDAGSRIMFGVPTACGFCS